ncbi:short-chain dehydrogenase/reductase SDR [Hyaloraphidium curvatum]|nr:short-chain dehydrogenase/reductase SDR [Hyaloraphidium curvatum]
MAPSLTATQERENVAATFGDVGAAQPPAAERVGERGMGLGLKGLRVIVTGGTKGIGRAIADILVESGAHVAICARKDVAPAVAEIQALDPSVKVYGAECDLSAGAAAVKAFVDGAVEALGGLDVVVSNAAALAVGATEEAYKANFTVDVLGFQLLVDATVPHLLKSDVASVVAIASTSGRSASQPDPYGAMKAALIHLVKGFAVKYSKDRIRFNAVSPGAVYFPGGVWQWVENNMKPMFDDMKTKNPTGRFATAREIARSVAFLASPAASWVSGTNLVADGAFSQGVGL